MDDLSDSSAAPLGGHLEDPRGTHPAAHAHRDEPAPATSAPELVDQLRRELRTGRAEWVAERDRPAVDVHAILGHAELTHGGENLRRERLVEFDEVDVGERHAGERSAFGRP